VFLKGTLGGKPVSTPKSLLGSNFNFIIYLKTSSIQFQEISMRGLGVLNKVTGTLFSNRSPGRPGAEPILV